MKVVKYILSAIFILSGLSSIVNKPIIGSILLVVLGIILFPNISDIIKKKFNKWNSKGLRYTGYFLLFFAASVIINSVGAKIDIEAKNSPSNSIKVKIEEKKYLRKLKDSINEILLKRQLNICSINEDISLLEIEAIKVADKRYPNFDYPQHGDYSEKVRINATNKYLRKMKITEGLLDKILIFNIECEEEERLSRIEKLEEAKAIKKVQKQKITECYNNACYSVNQKLKQSLHNPKSFEKVDCKYLRAKGNVFSISITYRGENTFGTIRTEKKIADININTCKLIKIR
ncbi:hypothetical protein [Aquimarina agarilytica]|uniref:hypothetical protein n=1 Tax=Aquimarina agarilytica TaxID=1087449 RepID=UPI0002882A7C|nr:hypothetical protein [Aquimarina agarilytica]